MADTHPIGPGHYAVLGLPQTATANQITQAHDVLEQRLKNDLPYDEQTAEQRSQRQDRITKLHTAAKILGDGASRRRYDMELRGEKVDQRAAFHASGYDYTRRKDPRARGGVRKSAHRRTDSFKGTTLYPDVWIAAVHGRDWVPPPRSTEVDLAYNYRHSATYNAYERTY